MLVAVGTITDASDGNSTIGANTNMATKTTDMNRAYQFCRIEFGEFAFRKIDLIQPTQ